MIKKVFTPYTVLLFKLSVILLLTTSCEGWLGRYDDKECDYNIQLRYDYNRENESLINELPNYVHSMIEYLFDDVGVLYAVNPLLLDECTEQYISELTLPPGRYSVIAIGNQTTMSVVTANGEAPIIGKTNRDAMLLTLQNRSTRTDNNNDGYYNNCGRLYYGYRTFSVSEVDASRVRVDMVHSHCVIRFRIRWKRNTPPMGSYYTTMKYIPSEYGLMPQYVYPEKDNCQNHNSEYHDEYNRICQAVRHHILTVHQDRNILNHKLHLFRNVDGEVTGEFVMYRLRNETEPTMSLYMGTGDNGEQVMKAINLKRYFDDQGFDRDRTLKQEYSIEILIDGDQVFVMPISVADWTEGGVLG